MEINMGTLFLIIAFLIETSFAAYCIITKSNHRNIRSFARIGVFGAFVFFTLILVIQWSFRWYGVAILLLIWAALGAWTLIGKQEDKKGYKTGQVVINAIGALLLVIIATTPELIFPQHKSPKMTGKYMVATAKFTYTDPSRIETFTHTGENRKVNVEFWYPKDGDDSYPLVVFSHGSFGIKTSNTSTFLELASNGYVVCSIDHPYHSLYTIDSDRHLITVDPSFVQEVTGANNGKYDESAIYKLEQKWMNLRTTDINFVLDTILARSKDSSSEPVYQRIDSQKIGLMGHSLGGAAVAQVARERNDISAVINLDADMLGEYLDYTDGKYTINEKVYPVPILNIFADDMIKLMDAIKDPNAVIAVKHVIARAPNAFEVDLIGTNHMSVTDLPLVSPVFVSVINASVPKAGGYEVDAFSTIEKMNNTVLKFFNVFLKDQGTFFSAGAH
jgi:predicted dienelactone hydrolase